MRALGAQNVMSWIPPVIMRDVPIVVRQIALKDVDVTKINQATQRNELVECILQHTNISSIVANAVRGMPGLLPIANVLTAWVNVVKSPFASQNAIHGFMQALRESNMVGLDGGGDAVDVILIILILLIIR